MLEIKNKLISLLNFTQTTEQRLFNEKFDLLLSYQKGEGRNFIFDYETNGKN
jgi:hypothetical protein